MARSIKFSNRFWKWELKTERLNTDKSISMYIQKDIQDNFVLGKGFGYPYTGYQ